MCSLLLVAGPTHAFASSFPMNLKLTTPVELLSICARFCMSFAHVAPVSCAVYAWCVLCEKALRLTLRRSELIAFIVVSLAERPHCLNNSVWRIVCAASGQECVLSA